MKQHNLKIIFLIILFFIFNVNAKNYDLTIVGSINFSGSLSRIAITLIDIFRKDLNLNFVNTIENNFTDVPNYIKRIVERNNNFIPGKVSLFTEVLWLKSFEYHNLYKKVPNSKIKIAYSMLESTAIPKIWVKILNENFDSVVVPDDYFIDVYRNSGVKIPIFVIPIPLYLEDLLNKPIKNVKNNPFIFGCSAVGLKRKNLELLITAFTQAFRNNKNVILKIHSKGEKGIEELKKFIKELGTNNIKLINNRLNWNEYSELISSFDCYVLLSKGEGFSITPREAMAAGIPCILSNNTAHKTICDSGLVYGITSNIRESSYYEVFGEICGYHFNCKIDDVVSALKRVYINYDQYLKKAKKGRIWVQQYSLENLRNKYLNLIKPKKVVLGSQNKVTDKFIMINSKSLYKKYCDLLEQ